MSDSFCPNSSNHFEGNVMKKNTLMLFTALVLFCLGMVTHAEEVSDIQKLQTRWAEIKYSIPKGEQEKSFAALVVDAEKSRLLNNSAPNLIWEAIIRSTYAGVKGGLGALDQVKQAKKLFEQSIKLDPAALDGSAYTSLGTLYYQVPGWPIGFGDDKQAKAMLLKGLSYNPEGIDSNYFYGDFLLQQKQYAEALKSFEKALQAAPRPGRELADEGRRKEIETAITEAKQHL